MNTSRKSNLSKSQKSNVNEKVEVDQIIDKIDRLPTKSKAQLISTVMVRSGPLPMAAEFEKYDLVTPGAGDRILSMAEAQSSHRQLLEKDAVAKQFALAEKGQIFGFIIGFTSIFGAIVLAYNGKNVSGLTIFFSSLASLVGIFVYGNRNKK